MKRILLVEDNDVCLEFTTDVLQDAGYDVAQAENGFEALKQLSESDFDLVISDIMMPGMDGFELLHKMRDLNNQVKVISMSGGGQMRATERLEELKLLGVEATLSKPYAEADVLAAVKNVLS